ncbi:CbbQ/NirQ/NorQ/GpvN family protein [Paraburkholderia silvatlantica]|uniref:Nitric oxide reductase NorQ protein n=2 Tax=Paraburkholderia silvatlantica TaxID=321895 RepID=A0A2U0ZWF1_9BURK|nr:CbbQ/NirQ/NorQ/GpvN family protein [Paraburkholderia silvatlantica]PVY23320.1 nitric oxide reductase NorQ protein [Paraburkholderia silvatlantica]PXW29879.1 nitric oxide reductase NorQ protein [Paraburkholderia silvatlantica]PYE21473.1 nitric oxide reductase NorQ protein [Paraburkholderia silvatlantica]
MQDILAQYRIGTEHFYKPIGQEVELFASAYARRMPMILKGPTGCGKTRFVEYMAAKLNKPLVTVACNEDTTASDLTGRFLLSGDSTDWHDGPLTAAVRHGAICYLDEVVEARADALVVIHPLTDDRRILPLDKRGELIHAHPDFQLVVSYNPGYQAFGKDLKPSTRQRFGAIEFHYADEAAEADIVAHEGEVERNIAVRLVRIAAQSRQLRGRGLVEGISTRMLVQAAALIRSGIDAPAACALAMTCPLTDDDEVRTALDGFVRAQF